MPNDSVAVKLLTSLNFDELLLEITLEDPNQEERSGRKSATRASDTIAQGCGMLACCIGKERRSNPRQFRDNCLHSMEAPLLRLVLRNSCTFSSLLQRIPHPVQWKVTFRHSTMQISYCHKKNMSKMMMMMMMIYRNLDAVSSTVLLLPMPQNSTNHTKVRQILLLSPS
jgi:hypothetical protein